LDLGDENWKDVMDGNDFKYLKTSGGGISRLLPDQVEAVFTNLKGMKSPLEAYEFARSLDYTVSTQPLLAWLSHSLLLTSHLFITNKISTIMSSPETDQLYHLWGFVNNIFLSSRINAISKEKSSIANAISRNCKRRLSSTNELPRYKVGHKMDTFLYSSGDTELGCLEIGGTSNQTEQLGDAYLKLPIVMKDMMVHILKTTSVEASKIHIVGYAIHGKSLLP
ncbi:hypothetical protein DM01DRAFT_1287676, partial [Hesseltinella vesiculosa]